MLEDFRHELEKLENERPNFTLKLPPIRPKNKDIRKIKKKTPPSIYLSYKKTQERKWDNPWLLKCTTKVLDQILVQKCPKYDLKIEKFKKFRKYSLAFIPAKRKQKT